MTRLTLLTLVALCAASVAGASDVNARNAIRGHDAVAKRKRTTTDTDNDISAVSTSTDSDSSTDTADAAGETPAPAASTSTTPADSSTALVVQSRSKPRKVGLAWSNEMPNSLVHFKNQPAVFGMYTWSPWCPDGAKEYKIPCFPMYWGYKSESAWKTYVKPGYSTYALGPNEVNQPGQSQMSYQSAASIWRQKLAPLLQHGYKLISPSTSNAANSLSYMQNYFKYCPDCKRQTHAVALHFYGTSSANFIAYIKKMHTGLGQPLIWVTEVGCQDFSGRNQQCTPASARKFMDEITAWMDATSYIEFYSYFGMFHTSRAGVSSSNGMLAANGSINPMGWDYLT